VKWWRAGSRARSASAVILMLVRCRRQSTRWACAAGHHAFGIGIEWALGDWAVIMAAAMVAVLASTSRPLATCITGFVMVVTAAMMMFFAMTMSPVFRCVPFPLLVSLLFIITTPTSRSVTSSMTFFVSLPMSLPLLGTLGFTYRIFPPPFAFLPHLFSRFLLLMQPIDLQLLHQTFKYQSSCRYGA
jgi:hypothetical protein